MRIAIDDFQVEYTLTGPPGAPVVTLSHALATRLGMWAPQATVLEGRYRVLCYDTRGHGATGVPPGPYTLADLAEDVRALLDALGVDRTHFVGISMGGMIGQWLALSHPERLISLVLSDTSARTAPEAQEIWDERITLAAREGMEPHVEPTIARWFTPAFVRKHPELVDPIRTMIRQTDPGGYIACAEAIKRHDVLDRLSEIASPTLVIVGEEDPGTPLSAAQAIHERIRGSELVVLRSASHLCNLERADDFNAALLAFLSRAGVDKQ